MTTITLQTRTPSHDAYAASRAGCELGGFFLRHQQCDGCEAAYLIAEIIVADRPAFIDCLKWVELAAVKSEARLLVYVAPLLDDFRVLTLHELGWRMVGCRVDERWWESFWFAGE